MEIWFMDDTGGGGANVEKTTQAYYPSSQADTSVPFPAYPLGTPLGIYHGPDSTEVMPNLHSAYSRDAWQASLHGLPFVWKPSPPTYSPFRPFPPPLRRWDGPPTMYPFLRPTPNTRKASLPHIHHHAMDAITIAPDTEDAFFERHFVIS